MEKNIPNFINKEIFSELLLINLDDSGFLKDIIELYLNDVYISTKILHDATMIGDFEETSKVAHKLKGSSLSIGLHIMALSYGKIENLVKNSSNLSNDNIFIEVTKELVLLESYFEQAKEYLLTFI